MKQIIELLFTINIFFVILLSMNYAEGKRKKIVVLGDLMIGALIPVHEQPNDNNQTSNERKCGTIRDQYGVQRVEALLYILDKINNKSVNLLPGIKLGLEIRDECWESSIALEETIDFIKDTIGTSNEEENDGVIYDTKNNVSTINCPSMYKNSAYNQQNRILAVVGPSGSTVAINVQNLLQLFDIPQVGFSATSADLSNKKMYKTFLRVVPSDYLQVRAMVDIVLKMNWTYVFALYTDGSYGQAGMEAFRNETNHLNICLAEYEKIQEYATDKEYEVLIRKFDKTPEAKVIVCFCYGETVRGLLIAISRLKLKGRFVILGSDGWSDRIDVARGYYEEALGSLSVKPYSPLVTEFHDYFTSLSPVNNIRNVWFEEYWQERFKCYIYDEYKKKFHLPCKRKLKKCPDGFRKLGKSCFYFSSRPMNWNNAYKDCKMKRFNSNLININKQFDLKSILNYMLDNSIRDHLSSIQVELGSIEYENFMIDTVKRFNIHPCDFGHDPVNTSNGVQQTQTQPCAFIALNNSKSANNLHYCLHINKCNKELNYICKYDRVNRVIKREIDLDKLDPSIYEADSEEAYVDSLLEYQQDPKMSYVMNSFLSIAYGLDSLHREVCKGFSGLCEKMKKVNGSLLLKHIKETNFEGITGEKIYFNPNGDPPGRYVILNVQRDRSSPDGYVYKEVGSWDNENKLNLITEKLVFLNEQRSIKSECSEPCIEGHIKQIKGGQKCCWNCKKCEDHAYVLDEFVCQECPHGYWPASNMSGCIKLPLEYLHWSQPASLFALFTSFIGIIITTFVTHIFIKFSNTCVVKSTTRELSYIILVGSYLCYFTTIPLLLKPSVVPCYLSRILPGFSLSLIYGALLTKTNRISRILSRSKKRILTKKPRFMSLYAQIIITIVIIAIECAFIIFSFILESNVSIITYPNRNRPYLQCFYSLLSVMVPIGYDLILVVLCTLYAVKTRNLPENFNEAKFIGFSMYTTCVIWIAFIPLYFGSDYKVVTLCLSTSLSATVILIFMFFPKVYIIIFKPERNQRSAFTTSKDIRCHFGSSNPVRQDSGSDYDKSVNLLTRAVKKPYGFSMLQKLRIKTSLTVSTKSDSSTNGTKQTSLINSNKSTLKSKTLNVIDGSPTSSIKMYDRSCQTSTELLFPMFENECRIRKAYSSRFKKNSSIIETEDSGDERVKLANKRLLNGFSILEAFHANLITMPEIEGQIDQTDQNEPNTMSDQKQEGLKSESGNSSDEQQQSSIKKVHKLKDRKFLSQSFKNIQSKFTDRTNSNRLNNTMKKQNSDQKISDLGKLTDETENIQLTIKNNTNVDSLEMNKPLNETTIKPVNDNGQTLSSESPEEPPKRNRISNETQFSLALTKILETSEDHDSNGRQSSKSTAEDDDDVSTTSEKTVKKLDTVEDSSSISSCLSTTDLLNKNLALCNNVEQNDDFDCDIENEFMTNLDVEDENMEKFKKLFIRDSKLVLNWDYVQSSDYI